jgi:hypothetical protein
MLTEEQRNGVINTAYRWPNKLVPYYVDPIFSEYCSTKLKICIRVFGGKYPSVMTTALDQVHTGGSVEKVMAIVSYSCHYIHSQRLRYPYTQIALEYPAI